MVARKLLLNAARLGWEISAFWELVDEVFDANVADDLRQSYKGIEG